LKHKRTTDCFSCSNLNIREMWGSGRNKQPDKSKPSNLMQQLMLSSGTAILFIGVALLQCGMVSQDWSVETTVYKKNDIVSFEKNGVKLKLEAPKAFKYNEYTTPWKECKDLLIPVKTEKENRHGLPSYSTFEIPGQGACFDTYITSDCDDDYLEFGKCDKVRVAVAFSYIGTFLGIVSFLSSLITWVLSMIERNKMAPALVGALAGLSSFFCVLIVISIWASYHEDVANAKELSLEKNQIFSLSWGFLITTIGGVMLACGGLVVAAGALSGREGPQSQVTQRPAYGIQGPRKKEHANYVDDPGNILN